MPTVELISHSSKDPENNEDLAGYNDTTFVVADGATDKSGERYDGKTGGYIASRLVVKKCLASADTGQTLIDELNHAFVELYRKMNPRALEDGLYRFPCTVVAARCVGENLVITQVGDTAFRLNGEKTYANPKLVDELNAAARALYIEKTGDVQGSRQYILPLLKENQRRYANSVDSPLGYGCLNGTPTPAQFVKIFTFPLSDVKTLEIFTDGYFAVPSEVALEAWEKKHQGVERADPHKYLTYKSTKPHDDRTVMIIRWP